MNAEPKNERVSVSSSARLELAKANGDVATATDRLIARVRKDSALREVLLAPLVDQACRDAINAEIRHNRASTWAAPYEDRSGWTPEQRNRVLSLATSTLMMFPLPGGKRLQDATRDEIAAAAQFYERQAGDMAHKARWLQLVAQSVPNRKTAGKALDEKRLHELQKEAANA